MPTLEQLEKEAEEASRVRADSLRDFLERLVKKQEDKEKEKPTKGRAAVDFVNELKKRPCMDCGVEYPPYVMDFDHVRGVKVASISQVVKTWDRWKLLEELEKCDLVCSNCHRERTHKRHETRKRNKELVRNLYLKGKYGV